MVDENMELGIYHGIIFGFLTLSMILTILRLWKGPSGVDRVMVLDFITTQVMVIILIFTIFANQSFLLDTVLVLSVISFFGTVMYSRYLEKRIKS